MQRDRWWWASVGLLVVAWALLTASSWVSVYHGPLPMSDVPTTTNGAEFIFMMLLVGVFTLPFGLIMLIPLAALAFSPLVLRRWRHVAWLWAWCGVLLVSAVLAGLMAAGEHCAPAFWLFPAAFTCAAGAAGLRAYTITFERLTTDPWLR